MKQQAQKVKFANKDKTDFYNILKERVDNYFIENHISQHANVTMVFKTIVMLSLYFVPYILIMTQGYSLLGMWFCTLIMGLGLAGIGMSIMHDANHDAYSANPFFNKLMGMTLTFVGADIKNWKTQHNVLHHTFTNIHHHDRDIEDKAIMRFSPHGKYRKIQKFQVFYVFLFYSLMTLYWTTLKDLVQYYQFIKEGHNKDSTTQKVVSLLRLLFWKTVYITYAIVLPMQLLGLTFGQVFIGFVTMHFLAGLILSVIFQLAHVVEDTTFPLPDANGNIDNEWAIHQLATTADFVPDNKLITFYVGGLNYQAIHHLFPRICHVHYPEIAPIVAQTAKEFGVKYSCNKSFWSALKSHIRVISSLGKSETSFSAIANSMG